MRFFEKIKNNKKDWKIFFGFFVYSYISVSILANATGGQFGLPVGSVDLKHVINSVVFILITLALFCFAWDKKILNKLFWQTIFILAICWKISTLAIFILSFNSWKELSLPFIIFFMIPSVVLSVVIPFVALFFYAFTNNIWSN